jgi:glycerol-3-phosphate O-acyltransferase
VRTDRGDRPKHPLLSYEPNLPLAWIYHRFFDHIAIDEAWTRAVRDADSRGTVVYVLRNLSFVDFLALDYLTKRHHLPQIRFANDLGLWVLEPMGRGWLNAMRPRTPATDVADLERAITAGASAALFLKRPPHLLESRKRGKSEGDRLIRALLDLQRRGAERLLLVPQVFVWSRSPDTRGGTLTDALFGTTEWPGNMRSIAQFFANWRHATLRAGEPVDLKDFLEREGDHTDDEVLVRRLTYALLRRLERERRSMVGPVKKPADRLRADVVRSPRLQKIIADMAGEGVNERAVIAERALGMLREMQASLDMKAIAALDRVFEQLASRMFSAIEVDEAGIERLRQHAKEGTLVILPSHKSHMDYLALAWVLYRHKLQLPLVAAGDNLNFFPMGTIFRRAGAFFIRRSFSGDRLYAAVVDAYVRRLIKDRTALEFFLEGGRSRSGKLLPPKLGLLSIVVDAALAVPTRATWFCPVSINYERFVEEKALVHELTGGDKSQENVRGLVRAVDVVVGRYGRLSVQFGEPLTLQGVLQELSDDTKTADLSAMSPARRRALVTRLAYRVMNEINAVTAVTPGSLVATALLANDRDSLAHGDLSLRCERLARTLRRAGARFSPSLDTARRIRPEMIREAIALFVRAEHVQAHGTGNSTLYVVPPQHRLSLDLSKNGIIHFFVARSLVATALLAKPGPPVGKDTLRDRVFALSRLFKFEFTFRSDAPFERIFDEELASMEADGEIARKPDDGAVAPNGEDGWQQIELYARLVENFLEGYRVAARGLSALLRSELTPKDLVKRTIATGERMFLEGEIRRREAVNRPMFENAYASFADQGYLSKKMGGKVALPESYAMAGAVATIEARIEAMGANFVRG